MNSKLCEINVGLWNERVMSCYVTQGPYVIENQVGTVNYWNYSNLKAIESHNNWQVEFQYRIPSHS